MLLKIVVHREVLFNVSFTVLVKVTADSGGPSLIQTRGWWFILVVLPLGEGPSRLVTWLSYLSLSGGKKEAFQMNFSG